MLLNFYAKPFKVVSSQKTKYFPDEKSVEVWYALIMKRRMMKLLNLILIVGIIVSAFLSAAGNAFFVRATTISEVQEHIKETQQQLDGINDKISALADEQSLIEEQIDDLNAEIINTMTSIGMKEDEIAAKELELIAKQEQIEVTQLEYETAKAREEQQYTDMVGRVRRMYENGSNTYLNLFLAGGGLGGMLNRMDFVEHIYEYDRQKLTEFEETKNLVHELWDRLVLEKEGLQDDKDQLVADRTALESQKSSLDGMLARKRIESDNYEAEINKAKQEAAVAKKLLQQEQKKLVQLQAQQNKGNSSAANGSYATTSYTSVIDNASGSDLGKKVAKYACQYIGNPYVYGGTSLTNGADCSGFVYRVYKDFNYNLPRTSYEQRSAGRGVDYSEAQPGDLICYDGHIGIYIGDGLIVHASSQKTGIKVSKATYRQILAVRRIV